MHFLRNAIQDPVFQDAMAEKRVIFFSWKYFFRRNDILCGQLIQKETVTKNCQQLGDGNGKPDTVRAIFSLTDLPFPFTVKGYVMKYGV